MRASRYLFVLPILHLVVADAGAEMKQLEQAHFDFRITTNNQVGLTTTNYGFFGNNFSTRNPSFEYPLGTGYEHMPRAGFWIGGRTRDAAGEFTRVTTGTMDGSLSQNPLATAEYIPLTNISERSMLLDSPWFHPDAVSEQDFICSFTDNPGRNGSSLLEDHRPIGIDVTQEIYNWAGDDLGDLVIVHLTITASRSDIFDMYVGLTTELASGPKNQYGSWPPSSSSGGSLGSWFGKKLVRWDSERRLVAEHFCTDISTGIPGCQFEITPPWAGVKILGVHPGGLIDRHIGFQMWNWSPGDINRYLDHQLYALLSSPHQTSPDSLPPIARSNDPVELVSVGPFDVPSGASIVVDFAFLGGSTYEGLQEVAGRAQALFEGDYVVEPPQPLANCPRGPGFWRQQCEQKENGSTKFSLHDVSLVAEMVNLEAGIFDWGVESRLDEFCATIDPPQPLNPRKQAKRHFAALLATVSAGELRLIANNGMWVSIDPGTEISCDGFMAETVGELIEEIDVLLVEYEGHLENDSQTKQIYSQISRCLDRINEGIAVPLDECYAQEVSDPQDGTENRIRPGLVRVEPPVPNPYRRETLIRYSVPPEAAGLIEIGVYDVAGRLVRGLINDRHSAGDHEVVWNGTNAAGIRVPQGIYFLRVVEKNSGRATVSRVLYLR